MSSGHSGDVPRPRRGSGDAAARDAAVNQDCQIDDRGSDLEMFHGWLQRSCMPGVARLRSKHSDNFSVLDNYGLPPERTIARFGNDGEGRRNMRKCLSELSLRGRRVLFLPKLALSPRRCGNHRHNSLIVRECHCCSCFARAIGGPAAFTSKSICQTPWRPRSFPAPLNLRRTQMHHSPPPAPYRPPCHPNCEGRELRRVTRERAPPA
jgi:hypothetical protein